MVLVYVSLTIDNICLIWLFISEAAENLLTQEKPAFSILSIIFRAIYVCLYSDVNEKYPP